jgi:hypothetical protein
LHFLLLSRVTSGDAADLFHFLIRRRSLHPSDGALAPFVRHLSRRRDLPAVRALIHPPLSGPSRSTPMSSSSPEPGAQRNALKVFEKLPEQLRNHEALTLLVSSLSAGSFPSHAERAAKKVANEIFPDDNICTLLVSGILAMPIWW